MTLPERTPAQATSTEKRSVGKGLFSKCAGCGVVFTAEELSAKWHVCSSCGHHHPMTPAEWRALLLDEGRLELWDDHIVSADPLGFQDGRPYPDRIQRAQRMTQASDAIEIGAARIDDRRIAWGCYVFGFMGGSMGSVVGERITRLFERATSERVPVVLLHASGGARMQEGILSLMQMAKTVSALRRYREAKKPFISVLLHPTTGGLAAGTAFLVGVNLVEPGALVGFPGPRVIESTLRTTLPEGFQRAEFLLEHGMVDDIVPRPALRATLARLLTHLGGAPA